MSVQKTRRTPLARISDIFLGLMLCAGFPGVLGADSSSSLSGEAWLLQPRAGLFQSDGPGVRAQENRQKAKYGPSLFAGRAKAGLFAPVPRIARTAAKQRHGIALPLPIHLDARAKRFHATQDQMQRLRALIRQAESRKDGYDAVQHGARIKPPLPPTRMTLAQIYHWIEKTPGQPHAIGKYQFIPKTLRRLVKDQGLPLGTQFTPAVQDRLADQLLAEAGLSRFLRGALARHDLMNNLAKIWAGLPNQSGKSHYHGYAGNKAHLSWSDFDAEMKAIFPKL